jgi:hypothetical protein
MTPTTDMTPADKMLLARCREQVPTSWRLRPQVEDLLWTPQGQLRGIRATSLVGRYRGKGLVLATVTITASASDSAGPAHAWLNVRNVETRVHRDAAVAPWAHRLGVVARASRPPSPPLQVTLPREDFTHVPADP